MTAVYGEARQDRVNGGAPSNVIPLPGQRPKEGWELLKEWADQHGWDGHQFAGALIRAATPEERKRFPKQRAALESNCRRWLNGSAVPDAHRGDPNATGFYRPIIARMMGTTPEKIWPGQRWGNAKAVTASGELSFRRQKATARLAELRQEMQDLQDRLRRIHDLEDAISDTEAEVRYLDAMMAVPVPNFTRARQRAW
jgi:hypothetical protein